MKVDDIATRTKAMRLLRCGDVGVKWGHMCCLDSSLSYSSSSEGSTWVNVFTSPLRDVQQLVEMKERHLRLHAVAEELGIIEEGKKRPIRTLESLIDQEKQRLVSEDVLKACLEERQELLQQAQENYPSQSFQKLNAMIEKLDFDPHFGEPEPHSTSTKKTCLLREEMDQLLKMNFFYFSTENPRLPSGCVTSVSKLIFDGTSGRTGEGKHRSLKMLKKMADKREREYQNMLPDDSKAQESNSEEKQDGECVCVCFGRLCVPSSLSVVRLTILCPIVARYMCS